MPNCFGTSDQEPYCKIVNMMCIFLGYTSQKVSKKIVTLTLIKKDYVSKPYFLPKKHRLLACYKYLYSQEP